LAELSANVIRRAGTVDAVDESEPAGEQMKGADTAMADAVNAVAEFVVNVLRGEHGPGAAAEVGGVESSLESSLAVLELLV
jgi:hypothetical protein